MLFSFKSNEEQLLHLTRDNDLSVLFKLMFPLVFVIHFVTYAISIAHLWTSRYKILRMNIDNITY